MWTFLSRTRISYLEAQRRGREEITEVVLGRIRVHSIMENEIRWGAKNSLTYYCYPVWFNFVKSKLIVIQRVQAH